MGSLTTLDNFDASPGLGPLTGHLGAAAHLHLDQGLRPTQAKGGFGAPLSFPSTLNESPMVTS